MVTINRPGHPGARAVRLQPRKMILNTLSTLGKLYSYDDGSQKYDVVLGLKASPQIRGLLGQTIGSDKYGVNDRNMVVSVSAGYTPRVLSALNQDTGLQLSFLSAYVAHEMIISSGDYSYLAAGILKSEHIASFWTASVDPATRQLIAAPAFSYVFMPIARLDHANGAEQRGLVLSMVRPG